MGSSVWSGKRGDDSDAANVINRVALPRRLIALLMAAALLAGCVSHVAEPGPAVERPAETTDAFVMPDGYRLPYRAWMPKEKPWAVVLALHGMNDSRDAWEYPAPDLAEAGVAVFSPDQRGFGNTATRGLWPGTSGLVDDAATMARLLRARYPRAKLFLMGESMGAAVLMVLGAQPRPPPVDGYVLIAPAVWGRAEMNPFLRAGLWLFANLVPGMEVTGQGFVKVTASDNHEAIRRLSTDPLTIHGTRWDTIRGLVNLMDAALAAAPHFHRPALFLYGGHDELIPDKATAATWRALPAGPDEAFYPAGYHLMLRDHERVTPIEDIVAWLRRTGAPLPSGADRAAAAWLAEQH